MLCFSFTNKNVKHPQFFTWNTKYLQRIFFIFSKSNHTNNQKKQNTNQLPPLPRRVVLL